MPQRRCFLNGWLQDKGKVWRKLRGMKVGKRGGEGDHTLCAETTRPQISSKIPLQLTKWCMGMDFLMEPAKEL